MQRLTFSVDAKLLRELGERLVGRAHIALAELVKNSYDADATSVVIRFGEDLIEVLDNGHGMALEDFKRFWMRIGSAHKEEQHVSRFFKRPLTGSKGIGRLAVQFLASELELITTERSNEATQLRAIVDWTEAVRAPELTSAEVHYEQIPRTVEFPNGSDSGTIIRLRALSQSWKEPQLVDLAREIWWLQPPFRPNPKLVKDQTSAFKVDLEFPDKEVVESFDAQMRAISFLWHARLVGSLGTWKGECDGRRCVRLLLEFAGGKHSIIYYRPAQFGDLLHQAAFEIRIFHLKYKQPFGIQVGEAREYLNKYGGVHVYDADFHLPYYGPEQDWLGIEMDHSHRLASSRFLPDNLQTVGGLTYLPTTSRLLGTVYVNTSKERRRIIAAQGEREAKKALQIQMSRDRLVDNQAYRDLVAIVRWALDYYATQEAERQYESALESRAEERVVEKFERVDQVLEHYRSAIPETAYQTLRSGIEGAIKASEAEADLKVKQISLLGPLATAGMSALAFEHEIRKQFETLRQIARELVNVQSATKEARENVRGLGRRIEEWIQNAEETRRLFGPLMDEENRKIERRFSASKVIKEVVTHSKPFLRGVTVDYSGVATDILLPIGTFVEWMSLFQNVLVNAVNATLDSNLKRIVVSSRISGKTRFVFVQDTGVGVAPKHSEKLFEPFHRELKLSRARMALGLGGSGLGLAIVRMIAENRNAHVGFGKPDAGFSTAFQLSWSEQ